ncbi:unnamed protein product, partial [Closterium sp. NIES-65]
SPLRASSQAADAASSKASSKAASEDDQVVGSRMKINGRSLTFNALRCAAIPAGGGTRRVQVSWQQEGEAGCTAIQFFKSPKCTGKAVDTVVQGKQRSKPLRKAVKSARCITGSTSSRAPDSNNKAADSNTKAADSNTKAADSNAKAPGSNTKAPGGNTKALLTATPKLLAATPKLLPSIPMQKVQAPACVATTESTGVWWARASTAAPRTGPVSVCPTTAPMAATVVSSHGRSCDQDWEPISSITVQGSDWRCKDVYSMYGLTLQQFTDMNKGIDCSALLPKGRELVVKELLPACSAFYYVQPADTCSSVAQFLSITEESLQQLNPGVSCSSRLLAFRSLCVERDPAKGRPTCESEIQISRVVDFKQVAASHGATMVDLCRLNPWISFRDSLRDIDGLCVAARYATPPPSDDTTPPPSDDTTPPPSDDTTPPPSDDTTPPPSDDTTPPPSDDTTPPPSDDTTPPPSDDTTPPPSDDTTPPPSDDTTPPPSDDTTPPPSDDTTPPPSDDTTPPPSDDTTPPPSDDTTPPPSDDTTPPPSDDTTPPPSDDTTPPPSDDTTPPPSDDTTPPSEYPDEESSSTGVCGDDRVNGCLVGTCIDRGTEDRTCVCLPNHRSHGSYCDQGWEPISSITVAGSTWRCKDVYSMYGLTLQQFIAMNKGINCSALLPQGHELVVKELLPACSAFYYTQPADTCSSVAQFLSITEESLQQLNPGVSCSSRLLAFRALCVERNPAKTKPRCVKEIRIGRVVDFKQVAASNGATMVDLCRLNPWISFRDSLRNIDGVSMGTSIASLL